MPKTYEIPEPGDVVTLAVQPQAVGLHAVADQGQKFEVENAAIESDGLYLDVRPIGGGTRYRLKSDHVAPVDGET